MPSRPAARAFTLIEVAVVIAVVVVLLVAGVSLMGGGQAQARRSAADQLTAMIEQARIAAITNRGTVLLALAEPADHPAGDDRARLGLFRIEGEWSPGSSDPVPAVLLSRWRPVEPGVVFLGGAVDGLENPLDAPKLTVSYGTGRTFNVPVHALAFHPRGGLSHPPGSAPVALRVAEGGYRSGRPVADRRGDGGTVSESRIRVGRVTARPSRLDG